jgi:hypothetical protein
MRAIRDRPDPGGTSKPPGSFRHGNPQHCTEKLAGTMAKKNTVKAGVVLECETRNQTGDPQGDPRLARLLRPGTPRIERRADV